MWSRRIVSLFACALILAGITAGHASAGSTSAADRRSTQAVITTYLQILNAGMQSGDFSRMASVYAADAVLTVSNPTGATIVFRGPAQIEGFYAMVRKNESRPHFTVEHMRMISPSTMYTYEHAGHTGETLPARCTHLYVTKGGMIVSDDFVVFFPGKA